MNPVQRKEYKRLSKEEIDKIIELKSAGSSVSELAHQFNSSERQIHRIMSQYANGTLKSKEEKKPSLVTQKFDNAILQEHHLAWLQEEMYLEPDVSVESLAERIEHLFGVRPSTSTIWRHIKHNTIASLTQQMLAANLLSTDASQGVALKLPEPTE